MKRYEACSSYLYSVLLSEFKLAACYLPYARKIALGVFWQCTAETSLVAYCIHDAVLTLAGRTLAVDVYTPLQALKNRLAVDQSDASRLFERPQQFIMYV